jgi:hypothetical protein
LIPEFPSDLLRNLLEGNQSKTSLLLQQKQAMQSRKVLIEKKASAILKNQKVSQRVSTVLEGEKKLQDTRLKHARAPEQFNNYDTHTEVCVS